MENTVKSVKNDKDPSLNQKTSVLDTSTDILNSKSYNSLNLYSKPENCGLGTDLMQNAVFYRIRPSFKIKTMKKGLKLSSIKSIKLDYLAFEFNSKYLLYLS